MKDIKFYKKGNPHLKRPVSITNKVLSCKNHVIKTFVEELSAGSSAAFRALNPTQQVDTQKQMVAEQQQANKTLRSIDEKIGNQEASNVVEIR